MIAWPLIALLVATALLASSSALQEADRDLIGWLGETYEAGVHRDAGTLPRMTVLSWFPRVFLYKNLLTPEECDHLIHGAKPRLEHSLVDEESGAAAAATTASSSGGGGSAERDGFWGLSESRTSYGMFYDRGENEVVRRIEERLARVTMLPVENGEGLNVIRYEESQKYEPHYDFFSFDYRDRGGGKRMATVLMYLATPEEGGETVFPKLPIPPSQTRATFSECAMNGMAVKPNRGDAVVFWSVRPDGEFDRSAIHGSCPVTRGEKWSAVKWLRVGPYTPQARPGQQAGDQQAEASEDERARQQQEQHQQQQEQQLQQQQQQLQQRQQEEQQRQQEEQQQRKRVRRLLERGSL